MGRTYKRKIGNRHYKNYDEDKIQNAVQAIHGGQLSYREAAKRYGIPWKTLWNKVKGKHTQTVGGQTLLTEVEERHLVDVVLAASEFGSPLTAFDLRMVVKKYLDESGKTIRKFANNLPGNDWALNFLGRHKHRLSQRICQNIKRVRAEKTEEEMQNYFQNLERSLESVPPGNILNFDETNLSDDPGSHKCIFRRGMKYPERVMNTSKASISVMFAITGAGDVLPPYTVYKAERLYDLWTVGGPKKARYNRSKSGWFDSCTFTDWFLTIIIPWATKLTGTKVIIGDNLSSHLNINVIVECQRNDIKFVFLPKNATHITQPLDVGYYAPLKKSWRKILLDYKIQNPRDQTVNKTSFPTLLKKLMEKLDLTNKTTIAGAFRGTGIIPFNPHEVMKRLPSTRAEQHISETVSGTLLNYLQEMRSPSTRDTPRRKKMLKVIAGKSVSYEDLCPDTENIEEETSSMSPDLSANEENGFLENNDDPISEDSDDEIKIPRVGEFVVIKLASKKTLKHFVAQIEEVNSSDLVIKYLRHKRDNIFVFPQQNDISQQSVDDIVKFLKTPEVRRGIYAFQFDTKEFNF